MSDILYKHELERDRIATEEIINQLNGMRKTHVEKCVEAFDHLTVAMKSLEEAVKEFETKLDDGNDSK